MTSRPGGAGFVHADGQIRRSANNMRELGSSSSSLGRYDPVLEGPYDLLDDLNMAFGNRKNSVPAPNSRKSVAAVRINSSQLRVLESSNFDEDTSLHMLFRSVVVDHQSLPLTSCAIEELSLDQRRSLLIAIIKKHERLHGIAVSDFMQRWDVSLVSASDCCHRTLGQVAFALLASLVAINEVYRDARLVGIRGAFA